MTSGSPFPAEGAGLAQLLLHAAQREQAGEGWPQELAALGAREASLIARLGEAAERWELPVGASRRAWDIARFEPEGGAPHELLAKIGLALIRAETRGDTYCDDGDLIRAIDEFASLDVERSDGDGTDDRDLESGSIATSSSLRALLRSARDGALESRVLGAGDAYAPLIALPDGVAWHRFAQAEARVSRALDAWMAPVADEHESSAAAREDRIQRALRDVLSSPPRAGGQALRLSTEQAAAVARAAERRFTLITGGPGTGKTSVVVSLLRTLVRASEDGPNELRSEEIALAAPTGKAAERMRRSITHALGAIVSPSFADLALLREPPRAQTLHRLLAFSPAEGRFRRDERSPLRERVVVVDEASMIDVELMDRLLRALAPGSSLVLLGDADQLPSVGAGAVLRDLTRRPECLSELTHSYRMDPSDPAGRHVLLVAQAIGKGQLALAEARAGGSSDAAPRASSSGAGRGPTFRRVAAPSLAKIEGAQWWPHAGPKVSELVDVYVRGLGRRLAAMTRGLGPIEVDAGRVIPGRSDTDGLSRVLAMMDEVRLLGATRGGARGVDALNRAIALRLGGRGRARQAHLGCPLIVRANDYGRQLWNGDTGLCVWAEPRGGGAPRPHAVFARESGWAAFSLDALGESVGVAHAITVHKAQGSEYARVVVVLPDAPHQLLSREILYTAVTRSRRGALVVAGEEAIAACVATPSDRKTRLFR